MVPAAGATVGNAYLPPGTIVSMCCYYIDLNPDIYPEPSRFWPERWLVNPPPEKWFTPFSKGSRSCIGIKSVPYPPCIEGKCANDRI